MEVKLKGEVFASAVNNGVPANDEFLVAQVDNHFLVPVFDSHGLPPVVPSFADAFAKVSRDKPGIAIYRRVNLEMIGADLRDAVVATAAASHEAKVCRLASEFEVELNDRVVEGRVFEEDSFGFLRTDIRAQQGAVTQREGGLESPAVRDGGGVEVFREDELAGRAHQGLGRGGRLGSCCRGHRTHADQREDKVRGPYVGSHSGLSLSYF